MVFIADDLGAWLVALVADAARKRLITWVLGSDQERALRQAANAAVQQTLDEFSPAGDKQRARQLTTAIKKALEQPELAAPRTGQMTATTRRNIAPRGRTRGLGGARSRKSAPFQMRDHDR